MYVLYSNSVVQTIWNVKSISLYKKQIDSQKDQHTLVKQKIGSLRAAKSEA